MNRRRFLALLGLAAALPALPNVVEAAPVTWEYVDPLTVAPEYDADGLVAVHPVDSTLAGLGWTDERLQHFRERLASAEYWEEVDKTRSPFYDLTKDADIAPYLDDNPDEVNIARAKDRIRQSPWLGGNWPAGPLVASPAPTYEMNGLLALLGHPPAATIDSMYFTPDGAWVTVGERRFLGNGLTWREITVAPPSRTE